jgi:hypothetical protein
MAGLNRKWLRLPLALLTGERASLLDHGLRDTVEVMDLSDLMAVFVPLSAGAMLIVGGLLTDCAMPGRRDRDGETGAGSPEIPDAGRR